MLTFVDGQDAVFPPGKIHGCDWQIYILYYNSCANNHNGCWEIEILDAERILALNDRVSGKADAFFDLLPDCFQGEWHYCNRGTVAFEEYAEAYPLADFILNENGNLADELSFIVSWAKKQMSYQV